MSVNSDPIFCLSYFEVKPDYRNELIEALSALIAPTRAELGCLQYELLQDNENPNFFYYAGEIC